MTTNYRPVLLTSHIVKVYERILKKLIMKYLEDNNILKTFQHGFQNQRSCLTELIDFCNCILHTIKINNDANMDVIYLDFNKAFD